MAVKFAFVSADTNAIPADTNAIQRMLGYPHQWNRWLLWLWLLLVGGFRSLCMHGHQVRVCVSWHKRDTSWHKRDTAHLGYPQQWNRWLLWLWLLLLASSGSIDFVPFVFMAIRFAFVSTDTNAIPADTNAILRMLVYPHQWNRWLFFIVIASSGMISFSLHATCRFAFVSAGHKRDTSWHKRDIYRAFRLSTSMKSVAFMIVIAFTCF